MGTYIFLGQAERRIFAAQEHKILIKQVYEYNFLDVNGSRLAIRRETAHHIIVKKI